MIRAVEGPLVSRPESWMLCFERTVESRVLSFLALGRYKHVRAYGYVPFLHVWLFFDVHLRGMPILVAADGEPAHRMIAAWIKTADLIRMPQGEAQWRVPLGGWCVPSIKRLIGLNSGALRPDALWRHCLDNGGEPFEAARGQQLTPDPAVSAATA